MTGPDRRLPVRLTRFGTLLVEGPDARTFLQGQLSADLDRLEPMQIQPASCNSVQGRVQAVVWLVDRRDTVVLILPAMLVDAIAARLRKYVLRSKVKVHAGKLEVYAATGAGAAAPRTHLEIEGASYTRWPGDGERILMLAPATAAAIRDEGSEFAWQLEDIRAGLPQVYPATSEAFVAQMLNLDLIGAIDYQKGCYTGQEIIARTHFRGTIKRRMLRFSSAAPPPVPGTRILSAGQHAGDVVDAAATPEGCELLAVVSLTQADEQLEVDGQPGQRLSRMPLPYAVPETSDGSEET